MLGNKLINTNAGGGCTNTVDLYNPFPDGGGVALYQLNGDATDVSGNYDGNANNVTYGAGEFGQAGVFNGSSSYIGTSLNFATNAKTVSLWFKIPNTGVYGTVISSNNNGTGDPLLAAFNWHGLQFNSSGNVLTFSVLTGNWERVSTTTSNFSIDTWYNVTVTNDATSLKIYLNGVLENTTTLTGTINSGATLIEIGGNTNTGGTTPVYYNGSIDQVRMFSRALRPYEVEALYTEEYCTPTIVPSEHFNTVLYTGNGSTQSITGVGFEPDFVWIKPRSFADNHVLSDSVRGINKSLASNTTSSENSLGITSFDSDGFSLPQWGNVTSNGNDFVAWNFKAGGAAVTNTDGTITSQVSANTEAGFSVITTTTNGSGYLNCGHGLGVKPDVVLIKSRDNASTWYMYHKGTSATPQDDAMQLNSTSAVWNAGTYGANKWSLSDTVIASGTAQWYYQLNSSFVIYSFAEVEGFSNFGSYVGTGASGNTVVTGFEPAMIIAKRTDAGSSNWFIWDNKRDITNPNGTYLLPNASNAENDLDAYGINFLENGFTVNSSDPQLNASGGSYIYMAFAADPTTIEPSLEDSFNTVTYTGNGSTQTIGGVFEGGGSFNGSSSYISNSSSLTSGNNPFSVSVWVNTTSTGVFFFLGNSTVNGSLNTSFYISVETGGAYSGNVRIGNFGTDLFTSSTSVDDGKWHHIAFTSDGTTSKLYIDGTESNTTSHTWAISAALVEIGRGTSSYYFNGSIDQVRFFNTALTAAQVTELYEETDADSSVCDFPSGAGGIALYELNGNANDACGTYNGTASNVTWLNNGVGFQPDLVWLKSRTLTTSHFIVDSIRGANEVIFPNLTNAETFTSVDITSLDANGFSLSTGASVNQSGQTYVAWNWKGAELPAINSNGSIPSVVSANPAAGFSIVSYTGNGANGTVGHGLGTTPNIVLTKRRNSTSNWSFNGNIGGLIYGTNKLTLNDTNAIVADTNEVLAADSDNFTAGTSGAVGLSGGTYVAYCFAEVAGFSKFGSYTGTGTTNGATVECGFEPAFVMIKCSTTSTNWVIYDNKRDTANPRNHILIPNTNGAEVVGYSGTDFDFNLTSFQARGSEVGINASGQTYIYMAFANQF